MNIKNDLNDTIINAAAGLLSPYIEGLSAQSLLDAIRSYSDNPAVVPAETMPLPAKPMTKSEVAEFLQISQSTVNRRLADGTLRKIGLSTHVVRIDPGSVRSFIEGRV